MGLFGDVLGGVGGFFGGIPGAILGAGGGANQMFGGGQGGGNPYGGMVPYPTYIGMDPNGMNIEPTAFQNQPGALFEQQSMRSGPSDMTQFALKRNAIGATQGRDQARRAAGGMAANAEAALSMKGGLGAGAKERIQQYATDVGMEGMNAADANASGSRANLLVADEAARVGQLGQAANMRQGQNQFQYGLMSDNLKRKQGEYDRRNMFNMNNYNKQMEAWAANKQAQATADSGKKS